MKKLIFFLIATLVAVSPALAQEKRIMKLAQTEAKKSAKKYDKEGYKMMEAGDLEVKLSEFFYEEKSEKKIQFYGQAIRTKRTNAIDEAIFNALSNYSVTQGGIMKGRATQEIASIGEDEINNYISAYERLLVQELKGEVRPRVTLIKDSKKQYDVIVYCLLDQDAAHKARMAALKNAAEEQQLIQKYGEEISSFIDNGLNKE